MSRFNIRDRVCVKSNTRYNYFYAATITDIIDVGGLPQFIVCDDNGYKSSAFEEQMSYLADGMLFVKFAEVSLTRYGMTITKIVTIIMSVKIVGNTQIGMYVTDAII